MYQGYANVIILSMKDFFSHKCSDGTRIRQMLPAWAAEPIWACAIKKDELNKLLVAHMHAASVFTDLPKFFELWDELYPGQTITDETMSDEELRARAAFAKQEEDKGHPTLHAHVLVALWAVFEVFIEDLLVGLLINRPEFQEREVFSRVKISLADFNLMDTEERARHLLAEVEQRKAARSYGVDRYEHLLDAFDLSGPVEQEIKKHMYAFNHIRNVLVHRGGKADRRLAEKCPWLNLSVGDQVVVTRQSYNLYDHFQKEYLFAVTRRVRDKFHLLAKAVTAATS